MKATPVTAGLRAVGREGRRLRITPRFRGRELGLLLVVSFALVAGNISLGATRLFRAAQLAGEQPPTDVVALAAPGILLTYLVGLFVVHGAFVLAGRRTDQILLPTMGLLAGIGLLLMIRLPQDLAGRLGGLAQTQLLWLVIGLTI
ncbi:MAG TPA: hypothetical protein VL749_12370, partial [Patescibacteria group bacterium]|nr:hypothetical protein [Patescibacteria group bacterium]